MNHTVTVHAIQTIEVDARDSEQAIKKALKQLTDDWVLMDAVSVDAMGVSHEEELYDGDSD